MVGIGEMEQVMSGRDRKRHVGGTLDGRRRVKDGDTERSRDW